RDGMSGQPFPEIIGGKGGTSPTPTKRSLAVLWRNPETGQLTSTTVLHTGGDQTNRNVTLRRIITTTRNKHAIPAYWVSGNSQTRVRWGHRNSEPYIAITKDPWLSGRLSASPLDPYSQPLPRVSPGDQVEVTAEVSLPYDSGTEAEVLMEI